MQISNCSAKDDTDTISQEFTVIFLLQIQEWSIQKVNLSSPVLPMKTSAMVSCQRWVTACVYWLFQCWDADLKQCPAVSFSSSNTVCPMSLFLAHSQRAGGQARAANSMIQKAIALGLTGTRFTVGTWSTSAWGGHTVREPGRCEGCLWFQPQHPK